MEANDYKQKLKLFRQTEDFHQKAEVGLELSTYLCDTGDFETSRDIALQSLKIAALLKKYRCGYELCRIIGLTFINQGNWVQAREYITKSVSYAKNAKNDKCQANAYRNLAFIAGELAENQLAIEYLLKAIDICERKQIIDLLTHLYGHTAEMHLDLADNEKAALYWEKYYRIVGLVDDYQIALKVNEAIGNYYSFHENHSEAIQFYLKNHDLAKQHKDNYALVQAMSSIGLERIWENKYYQSYQYLMKTIEIAEENQFPDLLVKLYYGLGDIDYALKKKEQALFYFKKVIRITPPPALNYVIVNALYMMALIYFDKKDYALAFGWLKKNIYFSEQNKMMTIPTYPKMLTLMAQIYLYKNDLEKANFYCNKANYIVQSQSFPNDTKMAVKCCQAQIYIKENENVKAKNCYKECLSFIDTITDREYLIGFYKDYSNLLNLTENYKETVKYLYIYLELQKEEQQEILKLNIKYLQDELDAVRGE
jgi:tetratricopeptide (TPR) repeat protein